MPNVGTYNATQTKNHSSEDYLCHLCVNRSYLQHETVEQKKLELHQFFLSNPENT